MIEPEESQNEEIVSKSDGEEVLGSDESDSFHLSIALDGKFPYDPIITSIYTFITNFRYACTINTKMKRQCLDQIIHWVDELDENGQRLNYPLLEGLYTLPSML